MSVQDIGISNVSLRHLKAALHVARYKNVTRAAEKLNRSQTAITKSIIDLEKELAVILFDRSTSGMAPTVYGQALANRVQLAMDEFERAGSLYSEYVTASKDFRNISIFSMDISYKRLAAFIALYEYRDVERAASTLNITRAAVYNSVRELETLLDLKLFDRTANGIEATEFCLMLVRHIKLAFSQIRHGLAEIASINGVNRGLVTIGTLPYTRTMIVPRAINRLLLRHPKLDVATREGLYHVLESDLRGGDIDLLVGALRPPAITPDLVTEPLFDDRLSVIARKDHPLAKKKRINLEDLNEVTWVLPPKNAPSRVLFDAILAHHDLQQPAHCVETGSYSTIRGLLLQSDRVALLSEHLIYYEKEFGLLSVLPVELENSYRSIGVTMRAQATLSPAAKLFLEELRQVAREAVLPGSLKH